MGAWDPPEKPRAPQNELKEEEEESALDDPVLEDAGNNAPTPFTPFVNAPSCTGTIDAQRDDVII